MSRGSKGGVAIAAAAIVAGVLAQGAGAVITLKADYQFHNNRSSSVPGAPDLADLGSGNAFATESVNGCQTRVLTFPKGNGLQVDTSGLIPGPLFHQTVVIDLRLADVSGYRRLIQSNDTATPDTGLYVHNGLVDWYEAGDHQTGTSPVIPNNGYVEVALLQNPILDRFIQSGFVNGVEQTDFTSDFSTGSQLRLFKDNDPPGVTGEDSAGAVSRIRIYNAMTPAEVGTIFSQSALANPSTCPAASTSGTGKPKARKGSKGAIVVDTGITANCPDTGVDCNGTASVDGGGAKKSKGSKRLGASSFSVPAGKSQTVIVSLSKAGKKALRKKGKLKVSTAVSVTGPNGKPVSAQSAGKIKPPKKHR